MFISKGKEDALVTKNLVPGETIYDEKRVSVQIFNLKDWCFFMVFSLMDTWKFEYLFIFCLEKVLLVLVLNSFSCLNLQNGDGTKVEFTDHFRSKLAAAILGSVDHIWIVRTIYFTSTQRICCFIVKRKSCSWIKLWKVL